MREFNTDFHVHSRYSGGSSRDMTLPNIAKHAGIKGLDLVGTSDALHPKWLSHIREKLTDDGGVYGIEGSKTKFIITTEVEDNKRVHHVILLPSIDSAVDLRERLNKFSVDIDKDGRPHLRLNGQQIADYVKSVEGLIGPSHAFTPWTAIFKEYDSLRECYGNNRGSVKFLELGLSADTDMADRISELGDVVFMSNSDAHSPWPHRLGREFNRLLLKELSFGEVRRAISRNGGRKFVLNVGLNPREGKYHLTACSRCYLKFKISDAARLSWRCPECRGTIKKGVNDRVDELSTSKTPNHPKHRPPYVHILPLAEVIMLVKGIKTVNSKDVQRTYDGLIKAFGTEINVLVDSKIEEIRKTDRDIAGVIERFRSGKMYYVAGGGGQYGRPTLTREKDNYWGYGQKSLLEF